MELMNLQDHAWTILKVAAENSADIPHAVDMFIANMKVMNHAFKGTESLNIRAMGQLWNQMTSDTRNQLRKDVTTLLEDNSATLMRLYRNDDREEFERVLGR